MSFRSKRISEVCDPEGGERPGVKCSFFEFFRGVFPRASRRIQNDSLALSSSAVGGFLPVIVIFAFLSFAFCPLLSALPAADVETMDNRGYFPKLHELFTSAQSSIRVIMFSAAYYPGKTGSPTNILIDDLIAAKKRGVTVEVILERGEKDRDADLNEKNGLVKSILEKEGVLVYNDSTKITTHSKLVIIDDAITVIGSTNWSFSAVAKNNETAVAIDSKEVAKHYREYFEKVKKQ